jgi:hypothetical protein
LYLTWVELSTTRLIMIVTPAGWILQLQNWKKRGLGQFTVSYDVHSSFCVSTMGVLRSS